MGQIKNIKLHIVTDIKCELVVEFLCGHQSGSHMWSGPSSVILHTCWFLILTWWLSGDLLRHYLSPSSSTLSTRSIHNNTNTSSTPLQAGWAPRLPWFWVPASVGFGVVVYIQLKHMWKRNKIEHDDHEGNTWFMLAPWQVEMVKMIPTRWMSRTWGSMCNLYIPELLRKPLFDTYGWWFNCKLEEAVVSDVTTYKTFNEYFVRKLKPGARGIDSNATLVSPADATVTSFGEMTYGDLKLDQIKGISYPLDLFVGPRHPFLKGLERSFSGSSESSEDFKIFYCSVYLAPGDYHW